MTETLELFPNVRADDPSTSHAAAAINRTTLRARVEQALRLNPDGLTDWEIVEALGEPDRKKPSIGKRRQECGAGDSGLRRLSPDGMECVVWVLR